MQKGDTCSPSRLHFRICQSLCSSQKLFMEMNSYTEYCGYADIQNGCLQYVDCNTTLVQNTGLLWAYKNV